MRWECAELWKRSAEPRLHINTSHLPNSGRFLALTLSLLSAALAGSHPSVSPFFSPPPPPPKLVWFQRTAKNTESHRHSGHLTTCKVSLQSPEQQCIAAESNNPGGNQAINKSVNEHNQTKTMRAKTMEIIK